MKEGRTLKELWTFLKFSKLELLHVPFTTFTFRFFGVVMQRDSVTA
jgi:hypothetical protein